VLTVAPRGFCPKSFGSAAVMTNLSRAGKKIIWIWQRREMEKQRPTANGLVRKPGVESFSGKWNASFKAHNLPHFRNKSIFKRGGRKALQGKLAVEHPIALLATATGV